MRNLFLTFILIFAFASCNDTSTNDVQEKIVITEEQAAEHGLLPVDIEFMVPSGFTRFLSLEKGFERGMYVFIGEKDSSGVVIQQIDLFSMPDSVMNGTKIEHLQDFSQTTRESFDPGKYKEVSIWNRQVGNYQIPLMIAEVDMNADSYQGSYIYTVGIFETDSGEKVHMSTMTNKNKLEDDIYSKELLEVFNSLKIK